MHKALLAANAGESKTVQVNHDLVILSAARCAELYICLCDIQIIKGDAPIFPSSDVVLEIATKGNISHLELHVTCVVSTRTGTDNTVVVGKLIGANKIAQSLRHIDSDAIGIFQESVGPKI